MSQNFVYPSSSDVTVTGIGTPNGVSIPGDSVLIAGESPTGTQLPVQVDSSGHIITSPASGSLQNVNLTEISGTAVTLGQKVSTSSIPVVIASDDIVAVSATSLPLPTGASTSALQTTGNTTLSAIEANQTNGTQVTSVSNFPATQPVSGTVAVSNFPATQPVSGTVTANAGTGTFAVSAASLPLPTGAATSANQATEISSLSTIATNTGTIATNTTGVSTAANQTTANTALTAIEANQTNGTQKSQIATPTALTVHQTVLTVGLTAVRLTVSGSAPVADRVTLVVTPFASATGKFYIGSSSVSTTSGIQIQSGQVFIANNDAGDYYIVSDTAAQSVGIMEQY